MKNLISTLIFTGMLAGSLSTGAEARDRDWAVAGKVLTGFIGAAIIADAISDSDYHHREYREHQRHRSECYRHSNWIPGHYERYEEQVWIPGETVKVWIEPEYRWENRCGMTVQVFYEGHYVYNTYPGHYETVCRERWVDGYYQY